MLNKKALEGLGRILLLSDPKDVKFLEIRSVPGLPQSKSRREAIGAILRCTESPVKLLHQQTIKKAILIEYLKEIGTADLKDLTKDDCIRICLKKWGIEDNPLAQKYKTEDEVIQALNRLDEQMEKKINEIRCRYEQKKKPLRDSLKYVTTIRSSSTSSEDSAPLQSPSSSSQFTFTVPHRKTKDIETPASSKAYVTPQDEVSIIMAKLKNPSSAPKMKAENVSVTPYMKPNTSTLRPCPVTPDSSDTSSMYWVSW